jgi:hypothetical protein
VISIGRPSATLLAFVQRKPPEILFLNCGIVDECATAIWAGGTCTVELRKYQLGVNHAGGSGLSGIASKFS